MDKEYPEMFLILGVHAKQNHSKFIFLSQKKSE